MKTILLVNGPNLSLLGLRKPEIYGKETLAEIENKVRENVIEASDGRMDISTYQSDSEGALVSYFGRMFTQHKQKLIHLGGVVFNPGAFAHTSIALRDALEIHRQEGIPVFEVHISNTHAREPFRHHSHLSAVASGVVCGLGTFGYVAAALKIVELHHGS